MHPVDALIRYGGAATRAQLVELSGRPALDRVLRSGDVVRDARGRYSLPTADAAIRAASAHAAVVSHLSAATHWGWEVKTLPSRPHLTVPRNRNVERALRTTFDPHWAALAPKEVIGRVTDPARTLADCLVALPEDEALCVADSALRHGFDPAELSLIAASLIGPGSARARRVAAVADARAANPFESVLRWISVDVRGIDLQPQVTLDLSGFPVRPDLVDVDSRLVVEADSHTWHSSRPALRRDCRRYVALTGHGWLVGRFVWEDVMFEPEYVREALELLAAEAVRRAQRRRARHNAA